MKPPTATLGLLVAGLMLFLGACAGCREEKPPSSPDPTAAERVDRFLAWFGRVGFEQDPGNFTNFPMLAEVARLEADDEAYAIFLERLSQIREGDSSSLALAGVTRFMRHTKMDPILEERLPVVDDPLRCQILSSLIIRQVSVQPQTLRDVLSNSHDSTVRSMVMTLTKWRNVDDAGWPEFFEEGFRSADIKVRESALAAAPHDASMRQKVKQWLRTTIQPLAPGSLSDGYSKHGDIFAAVMNLHEAYGLEKTPEMMNGTFDEWAHRLLRATDEIDAVIAKAQGGKM
jgi:hypothetical protein